MIVDYSENEIVEESSDTLDNRKTGGKSSFINVLLLLITALIWGVAFVAQSEGGDAIGPYSFNFIRFILGSVVLLPVIAVFDRTGMSKQKPESRDDKNKLLKVGICCGTMLCIASNFQQIGITLGTEVGKAGFLTACYILIVPVLGLFFKRKCGPKIWIGVFIALIGLYLLCFGQAAVFRASDLLVLICALCFSVHIMLVDRFAPGLDGVRLSSIQFMVCGLLSAIPMLIFEIIPDPEGVSKLIMALQRKDAWIPILYAGVMSSGVAYTLQIFGQKNMNPTVASLLMSLESVFSVLAGMVLLHQYLSVKELVGCVLIFIAIVLAQL